MNREALNAHLRLLERGLPRHTHQDTRGSLGQGQRGVTASQRAMVIALGKTATRIEDAAGPAGVSNETARRILRKAGINTRFRATTQRSTT